MDKMSSWKILFRTCYYCFIYLCSLFRNIILLYVINRSIIVINDYFKFIKLEFYMNLSFEADVVK